MCALLCVGGAVLAARYPGGEAGVPLPGRPAGPGFRGRRSAGWLGGSCSVAGRSRACNASDTEFPSERSAQACRVHASWTSPFAHQ